MWTRVVANSLERKLVKMDCQNNRSGTLKTWTVLYRCFFFLLCFHCSGSLYFFLILNLLIYIYMIYYVLSHRRGNKVSTQVFFSPRNYSISEPAAEAYNTGVSGCSNPPFFALFSIYIITCKCVCKNLLFNTSHPPWKFLIGTIFAAGRPLGRR